MSKYKKLGKNILLLTIGNFASKLLSFLIVPFYTAVLNSEQYGIADLITTIVTLLFPFFTCIICESMMRFAQEKENNEAEIYNIGMCVWGIGLVVLLLLSPVMLFIDTIKDYWIFIIIYYIAYSLNSNLGYFVRGIEKVKFYAISGIINTLVVIISNLILLLVFDAGVIGYLLAIILGNFASVLFLIVSAKLYKIKINARRIDKSLFKRMINYSIPLIPNSASWWISNSSDRFILVFFAGTAANGIYSIAYKIPTIISVVTGIFSSAWRLSAVDDFGTEKARLFYSNVFDMYITITVIISSLVMLLNKPLASILYQNEFYQAWKFVPILILSSVIHAYCDFFGTIFTSALKTKVIFISTLIGAITNIAFNFILIPYYAGLGAAIATLLSYIVVFLIRFIQSRKIMKLSFDVFNDIGCFALVFGQMIISSCQFRYEYLYSSIILALIVFLKRKSIIKTINGVLKKQF